MSNWSTLPFAQLYADIKLGENSIPSVKNVANDLKSLIVVNGKNDNSRKKLESGKITLINGDEVELNKDYIISTIELSDELKIDELVAAELLYYAHENESVKIGTGFVESGKLAYYHRREYILYIVSYLLNSDLSSTFLEQGEWDSFVAKLYDSFKAVTDELASIKELVNKAKVVGLYTSLFVDNIQFRRTCLYKEFEILSEILLTLSSVVNKDQFVKFFTLFCSLDSDDIFLVYFIPFFVNYCSQLKHTKKEVVSSVHEFLTSDIVKEYESLKENDTFKTPPIKSLLTLIFLSFYIEWCKHHNVDSSTSTTNVLKPLNICIEMGAFEQLTVITSTISTSKIDLIYDFKSLLEQNIPQLKPKQFLDQEDQQTSLTSTTSSPNVSSTSSYVISQAFDMYLSEGLHSFIITFISNCAVVLMRLKDTEEDAILSQETFELDVSNSDLERLYLSMHYLYYDRSELCSVFWQEPGSDYYGFLLWASKNNSPLITSTFCLMLSSLSTGHTSEAFKFLNMKGTKMTWKSITDALNYYVAALEGAETELGEDSIIFIGGFLSVVGAIAQSDENKPKMFEMYNVILEGFLKKDILIGMILKIYSDLVDEESRYKIWEIIDKWIFTGKKSTRASDQIRSKLQTFGDVLNFLQLMSVLTSPPRDSHFAKLKHPYPALSNGLRPYTDYLFSQVLAEATVENLGEDRLQVHLPILKIINNCLHLDLKFIHEFPALAEVNLTEYYDDKFLVESPVAIMMDYLFREKVYRRLLDIIKVGSLSANSHLEELVLGIVKKAIDYQETYVKLIHVLKGSTHGHRSFVEVLLFNLSIVGHLGLYVGSDNLVVAEISLKLLEILSNTPEFYDENLLNKDRLLTALESIDESVRIKFAFIQQLENPDINSIPLKVEILNFINQLLDRQGPNVAHFLLGFEISTAQLSQGTEEGMIGSRNSLLRTLVQILFDCYGDLDYTCVRFCSIIVEIIVKLCRNKLTSFIILDYLRNSSGFQLYEKLLSSPKVDMETVFGEYKFNSDLDNYSEFIDSSSPGSLLSFIKLRSSILTLFAIELRSISNTGSIAKLQSYVQLLINSNEFLDGSPKILNFLDVMEFKFKNMPSNRKISNQFNLGNIIETVKLKDRCDGAILDMSVLEKLFKMLLKKQVLVEERETFQNNLIANGSLLSDFLNNFLISADFSGLQLNCLHAWVQLIQVMITDGLMEPNYRSNFILELYQCILPKINDYLEIDISFAEELISLCILLSDIYEKDRLKLASGAKNVRLTARRLYPLFQTCVNGILCSSSTPDLRSDLYVLANKYFKAVLHDEEAVKELASVIKSTGEKLLDIICNDAICAEGAPRITSILFLESLTQLSTMSNNNYVLFSLIKNNYLLLLVRSIKRTDEIMTMCSNKYVNGLDAANDERIGITMETLLYELTAFKATLYFLIRVGGTRNGASQLLQCELYQIIKNSSFLSIDPDLGLDLTFDENKSNSFVSLNLSLDAPLSLVTSASSPINGISYYEILVPIFQLISTVLISMGEANKPVIKQTRDLLLHFNKLMTGIIKRDALIDIRLARNEPALYKEDDITSIGLNELVKLFILLDSLTKHDEKKV